MFPFLPPSGNRISVSLELALEKLLSSATSEKACGGRLLFCLVRAPRRGSRGEGDRRGRGYSSPPPRCQSHFVSRFVRSRHLGYNATGGTRIKSTTRRLPPLSLTLSLVDREHRGVSSLRFARTSFPSSMTVPCANTRTSTSPANRYANNFSSPRSPRTRKVHGEGGGRGRGGGEGRRANTSAPTRLSRFGKLKRKVGVDRSTSNF